MRMTRGFLSVVLITIASALPRGAAAQVTLYAAAHEPTVRAVAEAFEKKTGQRVTLVLEAESAALADRVLSEMGAPKADALWVRDHAEAARLASRGALAASEIAALRGWPEAFRDGGRRWYGFALRARVLAYDPRQAPNLSARPEAETIAPEQMRQMYHPRFSDGGVTMARPRSNAGSRNQCAALAAAWEPDGAAAWAFQMRRQQIRLVSSAAAAIASAARGDALAALADSDEAAIALAGGASIAWTPLRFDRFKISAEKEQDFGPLLVPSAAAVIKGAPNAAGAAALLEFLLSPEAERIIASGATRCVPLHPEVAAEFPDLKMDVATAVGAAALVDAADAGLEAFERALPE